MHSTDEGGLRAFAAATCSAGPIGKVMLLIRTVQDDVIKVAREFEYYCNRVQELYDEEPHAWEDPLMTGEEEGAEEDPVFEAWPDSLQHMPKPRPKVIETLAGKGGFRTTLYNHMSQLQR